MSIQNRILRITPTIFGTIFIAFGINALLNPASALSFFELPYPTLPAQKQLVDVLLAVYGVRDVFMGLALYAAAYFGDRKILGWITVFAGSVAFADGAICKVMVGKGEWGHWGYAPVVLGLGGYMVVS